MRAAGLDGVDARCAEDHGHAKRGGSVRVDVRLGEAYAPTIGEGQADGLLAMEPVEALRQLGGLKPDAVAVVDTEARPSLAVQLGLSSDVDLAHVRERVEARCGKVVWLDGRRLAEEAGNVRCFNVLLLGAFWEALGRPINEKAMLEAVSQSVPEKSIPANQKAFALGASSVP